MAIENPQTTLNALYRVRDDLLAGKAISSYSIGDRSFTFTNLKEVMDLISRYESVVVAGKPIHARLDNPPVGFAPFPNG